MYRNDTRSKSNGPNFNTGSVDDGINTKTMHLSESASSSSPQELSSVDPGSSMDFANHHNPPVFLTVSVDPASQKMSPRRLDGRMNHREGVKNQNMLLPPNNSAASCLPRNHQTHTPSQDSNRNGVRTDSISLSTFNLSQGTPHKRDYNSDDSDVDISNDHGGDDGDDDDDNGDRFGSSDSEFECGFLYVEVPETPLESILPHTATHISSISQSAQLQCSSSPSNSTSLVPTRMTLLSYPSVPTSSGVSSQTPLRSTHPHVSGFSSNGIDPRLAPNKSYHAESTSTTQQGNTHALSYNQHQAHVYQKYHPLRTHSQTIAVDSTRKVYASTSNHVSVVESDLKTPSHRITSSYFPTAKSGGYVSMATIDSSRLWHDHESSQDDTWRMKSAENREGFGSLATSLAPSITSPPPIQTFTFQSSLRKPIVVDLKKNVAANSGPTRELEVKRKEKSKPVRSHIVVPSSVNPWTGLSDSEDNDGGSGEYVDTLLSSSGFTRSDLSKGITSPMKAAITKNELYNRSSTFLPERHIRDEIKGVSGRPPLEPQELQQSQQLRPQQRQLQSVESLFPSTSEPNQQKLQDGDVVEAQRESQSFIAKEAVDSLTAIFTDVWKEQFTHQTKIRPNSDTSLWSPDLEAFEQYVRLVEQGYEPTEAAESVISALFCSSATIDPDAKYTGTCGCCRKETYDLRKLDIFVKAKKHLIIEDTTGKRKEKVFYQPIYRLPKTLSEAHSYPSIFMLREEHQYHRDCQDRQDKLKDESIEIRKASREPGVRALRKPVLICRSCRASGKYILKKIRPARLARLENKFRGLGKKHYVFSEISNQGQKWYSREALPKKTPRVSVFLRHLARALRENFVVQYCSSSISAQDKKHKYEDSKIDTRETSALTQADSHEFHSRAHPHQWNQFPNQKEAAHFSQSTKIADVFQDSPSEGKNQKPRQEPFHPSSKSNLSYESSPKSPSKEEVKHKLTSKSCFRDIEKPSIYLRSKNTFMARQVHEKKDLEEPDHSFVLFNPWLDRSRQSETSRLSYSNMKALSGSSFDSDDSIPQISQNISTTEIRRNTMLNRDMALQDAQEQLREKSRERSQERSRERSWERSRENVEGMSRAAVSQEMSQFSPSIKVRGQPVHLSRFDEMSSAQTTSTIPTTPTTLTTRGYIKDEHEIDSSMGRSNDHNKATKNTKTRKDRTLSDLIPRNPDGTVDVNALPEEWRRSRLLRLILIDPDLIDTISLTPQAEMLIQLLKQRHDDSMEDGMIGDVSVSMVRNIRDTRSASGYNGDSRLDISSSSVTPQQNQPSHSAMRERQRSRSKKRSKSRSKSTETRRNRHHRDVEKTARILDFL